MSEQKDIQTTVANAEPGGLGVAIGEMLRMAAPSVATMTSYTVMQFVDMLMVSRIDPTNAAYVGAQGNGGIAAWTGMALMLGILSIVNTYVSQHLGAGRPDRGPAYAWNGLWLAMIGWLMLLPYAAALPMVYRSFGHSDELVALESTYGQILIAGAFLTMGARTMAQFFYGMHRPMVVLISVVCGNIVNLVATVFLVFGDSAPESLPFHETINAIGGQLGLSPLGIAGAAYGTLIGSAVELAIPFFLFIGPMHKELCTRNAWRVSKSRVREIVKLGWPGGMMFVNEIACWSLLMIWLTPLGAEAAFIAQAGDTPPTPEELADHRALATSAGWIGLRYMHVAFMPTVGLSIAVSAIVGRWIGAGRIDIAAKRAWLGLTIAMTYMGAWALAFVLFREQMVAVFVPEEFEGPEHAEQRAQIIRIGAQILIAAAVFQVFDAMAIVLSAALRGAGDTVWPGVVTVVTSWTCIVGVGVVLVRVAPELGAMGPWIAAAVFIIALGVALLLRFLGGKWRTMKITQRGEGDDD